VYLLRGNGVAEANRTVLLAAARAVLNGDAGDLTNQLGLPFPVPTWPDTLPAPTAAST
jgi:hypothetical protein